MAHAGKGLYGTLNPTPIREVFIAMGLGGDDVLLDFGCGYGK
jgi:hypothetical protein